MATATARPAAIDVERTDRFLLLAATFFAVAVVVHGFDHARRGADSVELDVFWVGTAAIALEVGVVWLAFMRHRLAPLAAASVGWSLAAGYVLVHFLPARGWLSDSFTSAADVSPLSWTAASLEVMAAVSLGVAGVLALRARGGLDSATRVRPDQRAPLPSALHPVVAGMIVGNALILGISFAQL